MQRGMSDEEARQSAGFEELKLSIGKRKDEIGVLESTLETSLRSYKMTERVLQVELDRLRRQVDRDRDRFDREAAVRRSKIALHGKYLQSREEGERMAAESQQLDESLEAARRHLDDLNRQMPVVAQGDMKDRGGTPSAMALVLLEVLAKNPIYRDLQRDGCLALMSILPSDGATAADEDLATQLLRAGALKIAIATLTVLEEHADVQAGVCGFVARFTACSGEAKKQALKSGLLPLVVRAAEVCALLRNAPAEGDAGSGGRDATRTTKLLFYPCQAMRVLVGPPEPPTDPDTGPKASRSGRWAGRARASAGAGANRPGSQQGSRPWSRSRREATLSSSASAPLLTAGGKNAPLRRPIKVVLEAIALVAKAATAQPSDDMLQRHACNALHALAKEGTSARLHLPPAPRREPVPLSCVVGWPQAPLHSWPSSTKAWWPSLSPLCEASSRMRRSSPPPSASSYCSHPHQRALTTCAEPLTSAASSAASRRRTARAVPSWALRCRFSRTCPARPPPPPP